MTPDRMRAIVTRHDREQSGAEYANFEDPSATAAHYRSYWDEDCQFAHDDRGALLALLRALAQPVPYRPGLPTVEQVEAHWVLGGWWQRLLVDDPTPMTVRLMARSEAVVIFLATGVPVRAHGGAKYRPCLPNGTPCAWPGEPDPWTALEALR